MYSEQFSINNSWGIHGQTLGALVEHFPQGLIFLNGQDAHQRQFHHELESAKQVGIGVNSGDPTTDKNLMDIVKGIFNFGLDPWIGKGQLPATIYQQAADWMRQDPKFGLQQGIQTQPSAQVSNEMTATRKTALWSVVSLGELQQQRAVGLRDDIPGDTTFPEGWNPVLDGPNPDGPNFEDNAQNSQEQEMALQTWVNHAINMLERGDEPDVVMAKLAHDGCPEPEQVLKMALERPEKDVMEDPVTDQIGQDPFEAPMPDDGQSGQMESVYRQPPVVQAHTKIADLGDLNCATCPKCGSKNCVDEYVQDAAFESLDFDPRFENASERARCLDCGYEFGVDEWLGDTNSQNFVPNREMPFQAKHVRIANTSMTGVELDRWEDMWGQGTVKIALDDGGTINVSPEAVEEIDAETPDHPVNQIQQFIDSLPKVEPSRPHIQARIDNLDLVRRAVGSTISKVGFSDQVKLHKMDMDAQNEILALKESLGATISESDVAYLSGQQTYRLHGLSLPGIEKTNVLNPDFQKKIAEKAAIFVSELPEETISDPEGVAYAAMRYASENNGDVQEFMRLAEENRLSSPYWKGERFKTREDATCPGCASPDTVVDDDTRPGFSHCVYCGWAGPTEDALEPYNDNEGPAEGIYL